MKTKLLMLLAFVGMSLGVQAADNVLKTDWNKTAYENSRKYFKNTDYVRYHRAYYDTYRSH